MRIPRISRRIFFPHPWSDRRGDLPHGSAAISLTCGCALKRFGPREERTGKNGRSSKSLLYRRYEGKVWINDYEPPARKASRMTINGCQRWKPQRSRRNRASAGSSWREIRDFSAGKERGWKTRARRSERRACHQHLLTASIRPSAGAASH